MLKIIKKTNFLLLCRYFLLLSFLFTSNCITLRPKVVLPKLDNSSPTEEILISDYYFEELPKLRLSEEEEIKLAKARERLWKIRNRKGIYISPKSARSPKKMKYIIEQMQQTELNCIVVDMKADSGRLLYNSKLTMSKKLKNSLGWIKVEEWLKPLKEANIYTVARCVVFADPRLAHYNKGQYAIKDSRTGGIWYGKNDASWVDPYSNEVWEYNVNVGAELIELGFDEIQFDYIRFPTDGAVTYCSYTYREAGITKDDAIGGFLKLAHNTIKPLGGNIAVDVYGYSAWNKGTNWVAQDIEKMAEWVDVISPMYYPSHFESDFLRFPDPNRRDWEIMRKGCEIAIGRVAATGTLIVPFLQGFKWRARNYGARYFNSQIDGAEYGGATAWYFWEASNKYEPLFNTLRDKQKLKEENLYIPVKYDIPVD